MKIKSLIGLANHLGASVHSRKRKDLISSIQHRLYKDTNCGIGFWSDGKNVSVSGYCEGVDTECPSYALDFPFDSKEFDENVEQADKDGCQTWDETHGCDDCATEAWNGYKSIDPDCKKCRGHGQIL